MAESRLTNTKCTLYKFDSGWLSLGKSTLSLQLYLDKSEPLLVLRASETGVVRLTVKVTDAVIEVYPSQRTFSIVLAASREDSSVDKTIYQVKVLDELALESLKEVIEYVRLREEEWAEWRKFDRNPFPIIFTLGECALWVSFVDGICCTHSGSVKIMSSGKFELNGREGMKIGWCCEAVSLLDAKVIGHGAMIRDGKIAWCTLIIACYHQESAKGLFACLTNPGKITGFEGDLLDMIDSYGNPQKQQPSDMDKGSLYDDDLQLAAIFTDSVVLRKGQRIGGA
jgi:hypothetical protein